MRNVLVSAAISAFVIGLPVDDAHAQSGDLVAPEEVAIYIPPALKNRDFVPPLVCALQRVLVAPVRTTEIDMSLTPDMLATRSQYHVDKVFKHFMQTGADDGTESTFKFLLLPYDLRADKLAYVFAYSYGDRTTPHHVGIISTARLGVGRELRDHPDAAKVTALRVYKLMLKSIALVAGLTAPQECILASTSTLPELDRKSAEFCPADHETLVAAGILKAEKMDGGDCVIVSDGAHHLSPEAALALELPSR